METLRHTVDGTTYHVRFISAGFGAHDYRVTWRENVNGKRITYRPDTRTIHTGCTSEHPIAPEPFHTVLTVHLRECDHRDAIWINEKELWSWL